MKEHPDKIQYLPIGMCIGISIGTALGSCFGNVGVGMCLGCGLGLCFGSVLDAANRKKDKPDQSDEDKQV